MGSPFEEELDQLKKQLLAMAIRAETSVQQATRAVAERDDRLARSVGQADNVLDEFEKSIDEAAIRLLSATPSPDQLRWITAVMKVSHDLERVGDEATTIARQALELNQGPAGPIPVRLPEMAALGLSLLHEALEAFVGRQPARARAVIPGDKAIDLLNKEVCRELTHGMETDPSAISHNLHLITIAKSLERVGDHATNIAEEVVHLYEGADIRHDPGAKGNRAGRAAEN